MGSEKLIKKLKTLPEKSGVYIFKDKHGRIIYIGKAKSLKNRVKSYFQGSRKDLKTSKLAQKIKDFNYIVTNNEMEAFLLEGTLVKQHQPYYNILLKDDKTYPYIRITIKEKFPGVYFTRDIKDKNAMYFGPFFSDDAKKVLQLIYKVFKVRQCKYNFDARPLPRPCIYYETKLCCAPCVRFISDGPYNDLIKQVIKFLRGDYNEILQDLSIKMKKYSDDRMYELAADIRDQINAIKNIMQKQVVVLSQDKNIDIIDFIKKDTSFYFCVLNIRSGRLVSQKIDVFYDVFDVNNAFESYLIQYYNRNISLPDEILTRKGSLNEKLLNEFFKNKNINLILKERSSLLDIANKNIKEKIKQDEFEIIEKKKQEQTEEKQIIELKKALSFNKKLEIIDAIDISHFSGENIVASCVVFRKSMPEKKLYRRYKIRNTGKIDDYAAIREVVMRRYSRMLQENEKFPDLILIDGGIGQVNAAKDGLDMIGIEDICIIGLAKKKEEVFLPGSAKPVDVPLNARLLLQKIRDEAHRFALSYQTLLANKKLKKSIFDDIPFIGEKTRYNIYSLFNDKHELIAAIEADDKRVNFLTKKQKQEILNKFKGEKNEI